jgi:hypothetical protein
VRQIDQSPGLIWRKPAPLRRVTQVEIPTLVEILLLHGNSSPVVNMRVILKNEMNVNDNSIHQAAGQER